jgi:hypothetical protein
MLGRCSPQAPQGIIKRLDPSLNPISTQGKNVTRRHLAASVCLTLILGLLADPMASSADNTSPPPKRAGRDWWSLQPLTHPLPPSVRDHTWVRNPIDAFVLATLEAEGLHPAAPADRETLIRRATFDMLGLPPTPAEIDAFVQDHSPTAYEKLIDRLLASTHYGERWGRHWLDVARFGESHGYEYDRIRDNAWPYRDYVIRSFNDDKPYPQFIAEQLAGDVLEPVTADGIVATGFLVAGPWDEAGNAQQGMTMKMRVREEELEDMISAVGQTFLGMTVNCARCHNHKFDPIPQEDYYRLKAAFEGVRHGNRPTVPPGELQARVNRVARLTEQQHRLEIEIAAIERAAREKVQRAQGNLTSAALPRPLAAWTFETDARDDIGTMHGTLQGGAVVAGGRLRLNGKGAFLQTAPLLVSVRAKTLEAWVALDSLAQRGGGVLSLESANGGVFDAIVYGEREPGKWIAGSNFFVRTRDLAAPVETAKPGQLVHMAVAYDKDNRVSVYRNGAPYAPPYAPSGPDAALRTYPARDSRVLLGLRHTGAGNGFLTGSIEEARLYDRALSAQEVAESFRTGVSRVAPEELERALTVEQRLRRQALHAELTKVRETLAAVPPLPVAYAANASQPGPTYRLVRGDVEKKKEQMAAGGLSAVAQPAPDFGLPLDAPEGLRRRRLAAWIASADNPLTARVLVNRVWHYHFGKGIVASPNDFGFNGDRPTHPALLDWLASEFVAGGSNIKRLHRLILLSNTYRQSAGFNAQAAAVDADDRWLWRFPPRRLEGEAVRDAMLAVSGQLNRRMGGPGFRPFTVAVFGSNLYTVTDPLGLEYDRRTVYRIQVNSAATPLLDSLDCPDPSVKTPKRSVTTTPLQALGLMNNSFVLRQVGHFAERLRRESGDRIEAAYRLAFGRRPTAAEAERAAALVREHDLESLCWVLLNASEFLYLR